MFILFYKSVKNEEAKKRGRNGILDYLKRRGVYTVEKNDGEKQNQEMNL